MHSTNPSSSHPASSHGQRPALNGHSHADVADHSGKSMESQDASDQLEPLLRKGLLHPEFQAALSIVRLIHGTPDVREFPQICYQLLDLSHETCRGGRGPALRIAMTQAATLDVAFHKLLQLAYEKIETPEGQRLLKLAFRAQAQCARILAALPRLENENSGHRAKPKVNGKAQTAPSADSILEQPRPKPAEVPVPNTSSLPAMPPEPALPAKPASPFARPPGWKPPPWPPIKSRNSHSQRHG